MSNYRERFSILSVTGFTGGARLEHFTPAEEQRVALSGRVPGSERKVALIPSP